MNFWCTKSISLFDSYCLHLFSYMNRRSEITELWEIEQKIIIHFLIILSNLLHYFLFHRYPVHGVLEEYSLLNAITPLRFSRTVGFSVYLNFESPPVGLHWMLFKAVLLFRMKQNWGSLGYTSNNMFFFAFFGRKKSMIM